jgi:hypothetical protein
MIERVVKLGLVLLVPVVLLVSAPASQAYPPFLAKAEKYGAKDCAFCHSRPSGGKGWNARGNWLIAEKKRRGADQIDVDWLANYKGK